MHVMKKDIRDLFDEFVFECEFSQKLRTETLLGYKRAFAVFIKLKPDVSLETMNSYTITQFFRILNERERIVGKGTIRIGVRKSTVATYWSKLNSFFRWLKQKKYIAENPFDEMTYPAPSYVDKKFLKRDSVEKIFSSLLAYSDRSLLIFKRNLTIFNILLFCGLRREELVFLQVRDLDLERRLLTVRAETSKSGRTRHLPIHSQIVLHLKDYLNERRGYKTQYLIVSGNRDDRLSYAGLNRLVNKVRELSGVRFHLHQFRHTFAVNFLKTSNNIAKLKQLLGHNDIRMTMQYLRCLPTKEMRGDIENMSIDHLI